MLCTLPDASETLMNKRDLWPNESYTFSGGKIKAIKTTNEQVYWEGIRAVKYTGSTTLVNPVSIPLDLYSIFSLIGIYRIL